MVLPNSLVRLLRGCGVLLVVVVAMANADVAAAYWQTGGTGISAPKAERAHSPLRAHGAASAGELAPGNPALALSGNFENRNAGAVRVAAVTASIASVTKARGAASGSCDASDFTVTNAVMPVGADVPSGRSAGSWHGAAIGFNDKAGVDQNACMGAQVQLRYTISYEGGSAGV